MTRLEQLRSDAARVNLYVNTYSPGDGVTRYRFTRDTADSYFGPGNGIYTALGLGEANTFLAGYAQGYGAPKAVASLGEPARGIVGASEDTEADARD